MVTEFGTSLVVHIVLFWTGKKSSFPELLNCSP